MRAIIPTLVGVQVMLLHPRRRFQVIAGAFVIFCILSYVIISPTGQDVKHNEVKELLASPGPTKAFEDFKDRYEAIAQRQPQKKGHKMKLHERPTQVRKRPNFLNGMALGSNLDDFDVIGSSDLFNSPSQGYQDSRY